jgi:type IV secretory pathway VirB2 component (pilin)
MQLTLVGAVLFALPSAAKPVLAQAVGSTATPNFSTPLCSLFSAIKTIAGPVALMAIVIGIVALLMGGDDPHSLMRRVVYVALALTLISGAAWIVGLIPGITSC